MIKVKRALLSVTDKKGLALFARGLHDLGVELLSTGGTARQLREAGLPVTDVSEYTGFPEMLDGRVKTLHPKIHGGLLAVRDYPEHMKQIAEHGIGLIDMVVVNLYPFEKVAARKNVRLEEAIENIDIGGPSMLRSAAKNYRHVAVVCRPERYDEILQELLTNQGMLSDQILYNLALETFQRTAQYDRMIGAFLEKRKYGEDLVQSLPKSMMIDLNKNRDLRYGENPHQAGALYTDVSRSAGLAGIKQLHGKELSFNNFLDLNAAVEFLKDAASPRAVIIKHNNPTGVAEDETLVKAYKAAHKCDPVSAFGGIIGLNRTVGKDTAQEILDSGFMECVLAPGFQKGALAILKSKKNLRLLELDISALPGEKYDLKKVCGGYLVQDTDTLRVTEKDLTVVTRKKPTEAQMNAMMFGWEVIRHVKSNAILLVKGRRIVGIGCGQTSRIESLRVAGEKAGKGSRGSVLISDAFLPKTDNIDAAAKLGVKAVIQTGGSIADPDVIAAADQAKIAMVFTGVRHFKH